MDNLQIFKNESFGEVRVAEVNGEPIFCAADVCDALGYVKARNAVETHVDKEDALKWGTPTNGGQQQMTFVTESGLYALIFGSKLPQAKQFKHWVTSEVLPVIRKTGTYSTPSSYKEALKALLAEVEAKERLQLENEKLEEDNTYKTQIIEGLTEDIPLAEKRQRIVQIMNKASHGDFGNVYRLLYSEFDKKFHINVGLRMSKMKYEGWNYLDYVEKEMHMIPELYELACKLFESDYNKLIESWCRTIKSAKIAARRGS